MGTERILKKQWQQSYLCDRITKTLNDKSLQERFDQERVEKQKPKEKTAEELRAEDLLKELGMHKEQEEAQKVRHPPGTYFSTSYNPKGEKIVRPSLEKQDLTEKLHRDNWGRFHIVYDRLFETDNYHCVKDRNSTQIYMLPNNPYKGKSPDYLTPKQRVLRFDGYTRRKDITETVPFSCNQSRFENINKDPEILTRTKRIPNITFKKSTARTSFCEGLTDTGGGFYSPNKDPILQRLDVGSVNFNKSIDREPVRGIGMKIQREDSIDYKKAVEARTKTTKKRVLSMAMFDKNMPRDDIMLQTTDMYKNVLLENTRDERELKLRARKEQSRNYPTSFLNRD